jgi:hypothetical protein
VGNALYGLQGMSSDSSEVRAIVSALALKVQGCRGELNGQNVGNALYGLQGMSSDSSEVLAIVSALASKVQGCREQLNGQEVGNALYGLQGIEISPTLESLLDFLYGQLDALAGSTSQFQLLSCAELISLSQNLVLILPNLREALKDGCKKWVKIMVVLYDELRLRKSKNDPLFNRGGFASKGGKRVYNAALELASPSISVLSNEYLFGLFKSDIVMTVTRDPITLSPSQSKKVTINIEVDGIHHKQERKKRFCMLRDKNLKSQGVVIFRIGSSSLGKMTDKELERWLHERVDIALK